MQLQELPPDIEQLIRWYKYEFEELERFWRFCNTIFGGLGLLFHYS